MRASFSFCGKSIEDLGLYYVPDLRTTFVFDDSEYAIDEKVFNYHPGGYYYGVTPQPKEFTLRCFFNDAYINRGTLDRVMDFFRVGRTGKLSFSKRPYMWYMATVVKPVDTSGLTTSFSGYVTIYLKAYYPYARTDSIYASDEMDDTMLLTTGLLPESETPTTEFGNDLTSETSLLLYNAGNVPAPLGIELSGNALNGVSFINDTTGQTCKVIKFNDNNKSLFIDGLNGKVLIEQQGTVSNGFLYHHEGFLELAPCELSARGINVQTTSGSQNITSESDVFDEMHVGRYIYLNNAWHKITEVISPTQATVQETIGATDTYMTQIVQMNEIRIVPDNRMELRVRFHYLPTFR